MENSLELQAKSNSVFRNKNFMLLFIGKLVSQFGDAIYNMAVGWYILTITSSAAQMSIYMALGTIVYIVMGPVGGVIADRIDRKKLIIWMDIIRGIAVGAGGILMYFNLESIYIFYVISIILSICGAIFVPASNAMIPLLVNDKQLTKANSMGSSVGSMSSIIGLITGGVLYAALGIRAIFLMNAISYIFSGIASIFISMPSVKLLDKINEKKHMFKELTESYNFIKSQKGLFLLMWFATIINFILVPLMAVYFPYIFNQILKVSTEQYSYVGSASALGFIIGAFLISLLPQMDKIYKYISISLIGFCCLIFGIYFVMLGSSLGLISNTIVVLLFVLLYLLMGISNSVLNIPIGVLIQRIIPNEILGKVSSLQNTLIMAAMPLGMIVGGITADVIPMNALLLLTAVLFSMLTLYLCTQREIRKI